MNNASVENIGVSILELNLNDVPNVQTAFAKNEKGLCWDGDIFLYKSKLKVKSNLQDVIPVQIKTHQVESFTKKQQIALADLINFKIKRSIIFFSVQYINIHDYKIFYLPLHLLDLERYIKAFPEGQESKSFNFKELSLNKTDIASFLFDFSYEHLNQNVLPGITSAKELVDKKGNVELQFKVKVPPNASTKQILKAIIAQTSYLKYIDTEIDVAFAVDKLDFKNISLISNENMEIKLGDTPFFNSAKIIEKGDITIFELTPSLNITINEIENRVVYSYRLAGTYSERKLVAQFMKKVFDGESLFINEKQISKGTKELNEEKRRIIDNLIIFYQQFDVMLKELCIKNIPVMDGAEDRDYRDLQLLYKYLIEHEKASKIVKDDCFVNFDLFGLNIYVFIKVNGDECLFYPWEDAPFEVLLTDVPKNQTNKFSPLYLLSSVDRGNPILKISNINFDKIRSRLLNVQLKDYELGPLSYIALNYIKAFDTTASIDYLNKALEILKKVDSMNDCNKTISILNHLQIKKRLKTFDENDKQIVMNLISNETVPQILFACYVLIDDKLKAETYLNQHNEKEIEVIKLWPIYNLYSNL